MPRQQGPAILCLNQTADVCVSAGGGGGSVLDLTVASCCRAVFLKHSFRCVLPVLCWRGVPLCVLLC